MKLKKSTQTQPNYPVNPAVFWGILIFPILAVSLMTSSKFVDSLVTLKEFYLFFYTCFLLIASSVAVIFSKNKIKKIEVNLIDFFLLAYTAYCIARIFFANTDLFSSVSFDILLCMVILYFIIRGTLVRDSSNMAIRIIILSLLVFSILQVIYGYFQLWDFAAPAMIGFKVGGSFGNPGPFSNYIISVLPIALGIAVYWPKKTGLLDLLIWRVAYGLSILTLLLLPATKARTAWLAAFLCIVILIFNSNKFRIFIEKKINNYFLRILTGILAVIMIVFAASYMYQYKKDSANGRLFTWKITAQIISDYPVFGSGFNSFLVTHNDYQAEYFKKKNGTVDEEKNSDNISFAFNEYLQTASELGFFGLLLFAGIFFNAFRAKSNKENEFQHNITFLTKSGILIIGTCALFSYPFHDVSTYLNFIILLAIVSAYDDHWKWKLTIKNKLTYKIAVICSIPVIIMLLTFFVKRYEAQKKWMEITLKARTLDKEQISKRYQELYPTLHYSGYFLYNYGAELSLMNEHSTAIKILNEATPLLNDGDVYTYLGNSYEGLGDLKLAETFFLQAHYLIPYKLYPLYRLVFIYEKEGNRDQAIDLAKQIINIGTKVQSQVSNSIKSEMMQFVEKHAIPESK